MPEPKNSVNLESVSAKIFGMTSRRYRQLADEGKAPPVINGKIDFVLAAKQIIDYYRALADGSGDPTYTDEKRLKTRAERMMKQIELEEMQGKLIEKAQVEQDMSILFTNFKTALSAWAKSMPPLLFDRTEKEMGKVIWDETGRILNELAAGVRILEGKKTRAVRTKDEPEEKAAAKRKPKPRKKRKYVRKPK